MAVGTIPIPKKNYDFEMRINLGDVLASLRIYYNTRQNMWHMDLHDLNGTAKVLGIPLVPEINLAEAHQQNTRWGIFYLQDTDPNGGPYKRDDLGSRLLLVHYMPEDIP